MNYINQKSFQMNLLTALLSYLGLLVLAFGFSKLFIRLNSIPKQTVALIFVFSLTSVFMIRDTALFKNYVKQGKLYNGLLIGVFVLSVIIISLFFII